MEALIKNGADVHVPGEKDYDLFPLHLAAANGLEDIARILIEQGGADVNLRDASYGRRPVDLAMRYGHRKLENMLSHYGTISRKGEQVRDYIESNLPLLNSLLIACREQNLNKLVKIEDEILADGNNQKKLLAELKNLDKYLNENNFSIEAKNLLGSAAQKDYIAGSLMKGREDVAGVASTFLEALENVEALEERKASRCSIL